MVGFVIRNENNIWLNHWRPTYFFRMESNSKCSVTLDTSVIKLKQRLETRIRTKDSTLCGPYKSDLSPTFTSQLLAFGGCSEDTRKMSGRNTPNWKSCIFFDIPRRNHRLYTPDHSSGCCKNWTFIVQFASNKGLLSEHIGTRMTERLGCSLLRKFELLPSIRVYLQLLKYLSDWGRHLKYETGL